MKSILKLTTAVTLILIGTLCFVTTNSFSQQKTVYQCPMKCEGVKTYDKPGRCPVCGMNLAEVKAKDNHNDKAETKSADNSSVKIVGAMMNVMHKGELFGTISLDTIADKNHLYGLGPVENLVGEILIADGKSYKSSVVSATDMKVEETYSMKAPFFVYENVERWKEIILPDSVQTIPQLESYLGIVNKHIQHPFAFKVSATVDNADIHIVNLPKGTEVHSPEDAHKNQQVYNLKGKQVEMIGFFSTEHQGVFTHHDSFVHIHLITADKKQMGHLDELKITKGTAKLYVPEI